MSSTTAHRGFFPERTTILFVEVNEDNKESGDGVKNREDSNFRHQLGEP